MSELSLHTVTDLDLDKIRSDFPILSRDMNGWPLVFLDNAASSQKPRAVIDAISEYYAFEHANVHRGVYAISAAATDKFEKAREACRRYVHAASTNEIVLTKGTTDGINLVANAFERAILGEGDEVVISAMEHHSNIVPWQIACSQTGAKLRHFPIDENGELVLDDIDSLLNERTRIVALVHVSNALGTINPVERIIAHAHAKGIPILLDGAQAAPHFPVDVQALDVDFYATSSHKMYGPTGIGFLYGKENWLDKLPPYQGGGEMIREVTLERTEYNELPFKFEAGTPNIAGAVGLLTAIEYLEQMPWDLVADHEQILLQRSTALLGAIDGLRFIGTAKHKTGLVSFVVEGAHPHDIGTLLDQQGIAVRTGHHCTQPVMRYFDIPGTVRASFGLYNIEEEVYRLSDALKKALSMLR